MTLKPLGDICVLDFTAFPPGGGASVMLADLGADIVRVESPAQKGTPSLVVRQVALSRGKRSLALDMRSPASIAVLERLAPTVDVVLENAKPGQMESRGFGYRQARAINPGIIWCAITGFGQDGPYAEQAGHDLSYLAHSGLLGGISADRDWHPGMPLALQAGSYAAVTGIQAALINRFKTGEGAFVDISLSEAAGWLLTAGLQPFAERPYHLPPSADRRLYACADGRHVAVASCEPRTWAALCDALGLPEHKDRLHKPEPEGEVTRAVATVLLTRPVAEWAETLTAAGATVTPFNAGTQVAADAHVAARGSVLDCGGTPVPASPLRLTTPDGAKTTTAIAPPPMVGDDSAAILAEAGFTADEIATLETAGTI